MVQSKLITLLRCFNKQELKQFELFLQSPYFNQSEKLVKFFRLIEPHAPLFDSPKLEKEKLYATLHGKSKYNDSTMRELISEMFKLTKTFLSHNNLRNNDLLEATLRHKWFFVNHLEKMADAELEYRDRHLNNYTPHDDDYYDHQWLYDLHKFETSAARVNSSEYKLFKDFDFYAHIHSLNRFFLVKSFATHNYLLALARIYKFKLDEVMLDRVVALAEPYVNKGDRVFDIYFNIFQLARTFDEKYFEQLKARFFENDKSVPNFVMVEAGIGLENYGAKKIREGDERFSRETFEIYRFEIENNLYLDNGKLSYIYYLNVATRGADVGELEWTNKFIETHKHMLEPELKEDVYKYAIAHLLFARGKYNEALIPALQCNIPFFVSKILIRMLVARTQYELGMLDELFIELETHPYHLKDEKLTEDRRQYFQLFTILIKQLGELKGRFNGKKWEQLATQIESNKALPHRTWFTEKLRELSDKRGTRLNTRQ